MSGAYMKKNSQTGFYGTSITEGLITISDKGVMTRDIVATLKNPKGHAIAQRMFSTNPKKNKK